LVLWFFEIPVMVPLYQQQLAVLRQAFPAPVSDPVHDGYVVFSLLRALDRVDALKTQAPILGTPREPDYGGAALADDTYPASRRRWLQRWIA
jgi:hypothetical protein